MKTMLVGFVVAIGVLAWRSEDIANLLNSAVTRKPADPVSVTSLMQPPASGQRAMTLEEFAELSKTNPAAYQKLLASHQPEAERSAVDKLMNFLARGKYE